MNGCDSLFQLYGWCVRTTNLTVTPRAAAASRMYLCLQSMFGVLSMSTGLDMSHHLFAKSLYANAYSAGVTSLMLVNSSSQQSQSDLGFLNPMRLSSCVFSHCHVSALHRSAMTPDVPNSPSSAEVPENGSPTTMRRVLSSKSTSGRLRKSGSPSFSTATLSLV